jgi:hypothetical protein
MDAWKPSEFTGSDLYVYLSSTMGILGFGRYVGNVYIAKDKAHILIWFNLSITRIFMEEFEFASLLYNGHQCQGIQRAQARKSSITN